MCVFMCKMFVCTVCLYSLFVQFVCTLCTVCMYVYSMSAVYIHMFLYSVYVCTLCMCVDPGINYEGQVGVHRSMNIITKGEGVHKRIALCNKVHEGGCTCPLCPPPWIC